MASPCGNRKLNTKIITGKMNDICLVTPCIERSWSDMSGREGGIIMRDCANVNRPAMSGRMSRAGCRRTLATVAPLAEQHACGADWVRSLIQRNLLSPPCKVDVTDRIDW